eukprot:UC1_evm1s2058
MAGQMPGPMDDEAVLHAIFNPEAPFLPTQGTAGSSDSGFVGSSEANITGLDPSNSETTSAATSSNTAQTTTPFEEKITADEAAAVALAERGRGGGGGGGGDCLAEAEAAFTVILERAPDHASVLNNRAQVRQMIGDKAGARADLERALSLPSLTREVERQALVQRAMLRRVDGDSEGAW